MLDETMHLASTLLVHLLDGLVIHWPKIHLIIINKYILVNSEYGFGWHTVQWNLGLIRLSNTTNFTTKVGDLKFLYCGQVGSMNIVKFQCEIFLPYTSYSFWQLHLGRVKAQNMLLLIIVNPLRTKCWSPTLFISKIPSNVTQENILKQAVCRYQMSHMID